MKLNDIIVGDCISVMSGLPDKSVDLIFADPPYFMQTSGKLIRPEGSQFSGTDDAWDKFEDYPAYDKFTTNWLLQCKRLLKDNGCIWVIGSFHNIYRVGYIMQNLGFWIINDVIWHKNNPVPNFMGTRFTNSSETLLWCANTKSSKYTFNYKMLKARNGGKQKTSVWQIPLCNGHERVKDEKGNKAHNTQKPIELLKNVILANSKINDIILDPFFGTGTTGVVAKLLNRQYIGIEREAKYVKLAQQRISNTNVDHNLAILTEPIKSTARVSMLELLKSKLLTNNVLFNHNQTIKHTINAKGKLVCKGGEKSIHQLAAHYLNKINYNGWGFWYAYKNGQYISIDELRQEYFKLFSTHQTNTINKATNENL